MTNKKSFILYVDIIHTVDGLTDEEAGKLFKHLLNYVNDKQPEAPDRLTALLFEPVKQQLKRDLVKWSGKTEHLSANGKLGGIKSGEARRNKAKQIEANEPNASNLKQSEADEPVNVNVNVSVSDNVIVNVKKKEESEKHFLHTFIEINCLNVSKIQKQMSVKDCEMLVKNFGQQKVEDILLQMENKKDLAKKYTSVFLTANNWLKLSQEKSTKGLKENGMPAPTEAELKAAGGFGKLN